MPRSFVPVLLLSAVSAPLAAQDLNVPLTRLDSAPVQDLREPLSRLDAALTQGLRDVRSVRTWRDVEREAAEARSAIRRIIRVAGSGTSSNQLQRNLQMLMQLQEQERRLAALEQRARRQQEAEENAELLNEINADAEEERDESDGADTLEEILEDAADTVEAIASAFGITF